MFQDEIKNLAMDKPNKSWVAGKYVEYVPEAAYNPALVRPRDGTDCPDDNTDTTTASSARVTFIYQIIFRLFIKLVYYFVSLNLL